MARVAAVLATASCFGLSTSEATHAETPADCLQAAQLIASGLPQQAKALLTDENLGTACAAQLRLANQRIGRAKENAAQATRLAQVGDLTAAKRRALTALRFDQENVTAVALAYSEKCAQAAQLTQAGFPQRAIAVLADPGETVANCPEQWTQAKEKVAEAQSAAEAAEKRVLKGDLDAGTTEADAALLIDRENALAAEVAAAESAGSWTDRLASKVSELKTTLYNPVSDLLLPLVMAFASTLLISRLMVFVWRWYPKLRIRAGRLVVLFTGLLAAALASAMLVLGGLRGLMPAALSVALLSWWMASRLRVSISATKAEGEDVPTATHVRALLSELGASPPKGLEVPVGADAEELTGALTAIPGAGSWVKSVADIFVGLLSVTPWRVEIARIDDEQLAVRITRNGHLGASALIGPTDGRISDDAVPAIDQQRLAAAFILMTLSDAHGPFGGLGKTHDWRSLGLHYIATADPELRKEENREVQQQTLASALQLDPGNQLARLAWQHSLWRRSTDAEELRGYQEWLKNYISDIQDEPEMDTVRLRAAYTRTAVCLNWWSLVADDNWPYQQKERLGQYRLARSELVSLNTLGKGGSVNMRMKGIVRSMPKVEEGATALPGPRESNASGSSSAIYNLACWYAKTPGGYPRAVSLLKQVASVPAVKEWMPEDPMLASLRTEDVYKNEFLADPRDDFYALAPLVPHAKALDQAGYGNAAVLGVAVGTGDVALAASLQGAIPVPEQASVFGLARLYRSLRACPALRPLAVEILHELVALRLTTPAAVAYVDAAETAAVIRAATVERCKPSSIPSSFTVDALEAWLAA